MEKGNTENEFMRQVTDVQTVESQSSVEIKRTSRGTTFAVKVYEVNPDVATEKAVAIFNKLNAQYPQVA